MMVRIASCIKEPFLAPELCPRVAQLCGYYLNLLAGSKSKELKVKDKEKYGWNPREMITKICRLFTVFVDHNEFIKQLVADKRSYSIALMQSAETILKRIGANVSFSLLIEKCAKVEED